MAKLSAGRGQGITSRMLERVLVPVDFSENTEEVVQTALSLAAAHQAELYILYINPTSKNEATTSGAVRMKNELAEHRLADLKSQLGYPSEKIFLMIETGSIASHILHSSQQMSVDLIVMGSHSRSAAASLLAGSATEGVLRKSDVPVLVIPLKD